MGCAVTMMTTIIRLCYIWFGSLAVDLLDVVCYVHAVAAAQNIGRRPEAYHKLIASLIHQLLLPLPSSCCACTAVCIQRRVKAA